MWASVTAFRDAHQLARYRRPIREMTYWVAGINHMSWFLELKRGEDAHPALWMRWRTGDLRHDTVRFEIMRHFSTS